MAEQQAGWYPDPSGDASKLRYWDGNQWTNDFSDAGQTAQPVEPVQAAQPVQQPVQPAQPAQPVNQTYVQAPAQQTNGMALAALICGIAGLCTGGASSVVAIILGIIARKNPVNRGMATGGLISGIITLVLWLAFYVIYVVVLGSVFYYYY